jgi:hypothetical protein
MTVLEYMHEAREKYLQRFRAALEAKRHEGAACSAEVWVQPNVLPGRPRPPHPLCVDILVRGKDKPAMIMVAGSASEGALVGTMQVGNALVKVYAFAWEDFWLWVKIADPDWNALGPWQKKWMDVQRSGGMDEDGFSGVVHYLGAPHRRGWGLSLSGGFWLGDC